MACATLSLKRSLDFDPLSPRRPKRRRCQPMTISPTTTTTPVKPPSVFREATNSMSREQIAANITAEIKRLQHRRQLVTSSHAHSSSAESSGSDNEAGPSTSSVHSSSQLSPQKKDVPIFTFKQVTMLCEKLVKERTEDLCEQYDQVLQNKMAEQYEAFLKFNHDQLQSRFNHSEDASYVS